MLMKRRKKNIGDDMRFNHNYLELYVYFIDAGTVIVLHNMTTFASQ